MNIVDFFKNLLNSLVGTSLERMKLINTMNQTFKDSYCSGALDRFCKVSITVGDTNYAHEMSAFFLRSGFKISIENDNNIKDSEFRDISQYILSNKPFIRQLMTLGFDTLIVFINFIRSNEVPTKELSKFLKKSTIFILH